MSRTEREAIADIAALVAYMAGRCYGALGTDEAKNMMRDLRTIEYEMREPIARGAK